MCLCFLQFLKQFSFISGLECHGSYDSPGNVWGPINFLWYLFLDQQHLSQLHNLSKKKISQNAPCTLFIFVSFNKWQILSCLLRLWGILCPVQYTTLSIINTHSWVVKFRLVKQVSKGPQERSLWPLLCTESTMHPIEHWGLLIQIPNQDNRKWKKIFFRDSFPQHQAHSK